jgi:DNA (cytosine-5)-methyltransferase 1
MKIELREGLMSSKEITAISLFASSGIGDLALKAAGIKVLVASELLHDRAELFKRNFPETKMISGDIRENIEAIVSTTKESLDGKSLDFLFATPPCQGMSKNGRGKLLRGIRDGLKDAIDPRNQLATYVPLIVKELKPAVVVFENVPEMQSTLVENSEGVLVDLLEYLQHLMPDYQGIWKTIEFADFGVPQRRQRLITIFVRNELVAEKNLSSDLNILYPGTTHASKPTGSLKPWIKVIEVISNLPTLDAKDARSAKSDIPFHYVSVLEPKKYHWVSNTKPGESAFDNQCINSDCLASDNLTHSSIRSAAGVNSASTLTPIYCHSCGHLLPRPVVEENGQLRLMKGFTSAYKRMRGDLPSSALTTNLSYVMSDQKIHPTQHRPLSLLEAMMLHTITDFDWKWELPNGKQASDKLIRESIGESIPPRGLLLIFKHLLQTLFVVQSDESGKVSRAG